MYSKHEVSLLNQEFWTTLGKYLSPILSAEEEKINWINYKTGEKNIRFVMETDLKLARISIEFSHKDPGEQKENFEKLIMLKKTFEEIAGTGWSWRPLIANEMGKVVSRVYVEQTGVNILDKSHWPVLIPFFKQYIIALDKFWCDYKFAFER